MTPQLGWSSVFQAAQCFSQFSVSGRSAFQSVQCFRQLSVSASLVFQAVQRFSRFSVSGSLVFQACSVLQVVQCWEVSGFWVRVGMQVLTIKLLDLEMASPSQQDQLSLLPSISDL